MRPGRKKYLDFQEGAPFERQAKLPPYETRSYVSLTCPHCSLRFVEIPRERVETNKAAECLKHLRACSEFTGEVKGKAKSSPSISELMEEIQSLRNENRAQSEESKAQQLKMHEESQAERAAFHRSIVGTMERVSHELGLDPPPPKSEEELLDKIKENRKKRALDEQREQDELDEERDGRNSGVDLTKCLICTKRRRKVLHYPCSHISTCATCAEQWKQQCLEKNVDHTCIQCRSKVKRCLVGIF